MELFYELLKVAIGNKTRLSKNPSEAEWTLLFANAPKQTVVGVALIALEILSRCGQKASLPFLYEWIGQTELIKNRNELLNQEYLMRKWESYSKRNRRGRPFWSS